MEVRGDGCKNWKARDCCSSRAAINANNGLPSAYETALAKLACNRAGYEVANEAMQAMGGIGFSEDSLVQYCMRRARGWMIAGGSTEIMLNRIAEGVFHRPLPQRQSSSQPRSENAQRMPATATYWHTAMMKVCRYICFVCASTAGSVTIQEEKNGL